MKLRGSKEITKETEQIALQPEYSKCTTEVGGLKFAATVSANQCEYNLHSTGTFTVECPKEHTLNISIPASGCVISMGEAGNKSLGEFAYNNTSKTKAIETESGVTGITFTVNKACEGVGVKGSSKGEYKGQFLIEAENKAGSQVAIEEA